MKPLNFHFAQHDLIIKNLIQNLHENYEYKVN